MYLINNNEGNSAWVVNTDAKIMDKMYHHKTKYLIAYCLETQTLVILVQKPNKKTQVLKLKGTLKKIQCTESKAFRMGFINK